MFWQTSISKFLQFSEFEVFLYLDAVQMSFESHTSLTNSFFNILGDGAVTSVPGVKKMEGITICTTEALYTRAKFSFNNSSMADQSLIKFIFLPQWPPHFVVWNTCWHQCSRFHLPLLQLTNFLVFQHNISLSFFSGPNKIWNFLDCCWNYTLIQALATHKVLGIASDLHDSEKPTGLHTVEREHG